MTPLFTLTTPNGQTIEGYDNVKCRYCGMTEICRGSYPEGCFLENELLKPNSKLFKISDITEQMAKDWGYGHKEHYPHKFTAKENFTIYLSGTFDLTNEDISNILLILIEK